jgi:acetoacetyl-CoA synthetase
MPTYVPRLRHYQNWLAAHAALQFPDYESLWRWRGT